MISDERKREISVEIVATIHSRMTLEEMIAVIDKIAKSDPGGDHQQDFYEACRKMAREFCRLNDETKARIAAARARNVKEA